MTCHPSHTAEELADAKKLNTELKEAQADERIRQDRAALSIDPRKIQRHHRWKLGHDPSDQDDHRNPDIAYLKIEYGAEESDPDQLDELARIGESGVPCLRDICDEFMAIVGRKSQWDIYNHERTTVVNLDTMSEARKQELKEQMIVILACPQHPSVKTQWVEEFLPPRA